MTKQYERKKVGSIGDIGCFSFYATKNMTTGEGGMIVTNSKKIWQKCLLLRNHGSQERYKHMTLGWNFRLTEMQAALGLVQLKKLDRNNKNRQKIAAFYSKELAGVNGLVLPKSFKNTTCVFHQYTLRITKDFQAPRDILLEKLQKAGIGVQVYYPIPIYKQPFFRNIQQKMKKNFKETNKACREVLSLPIYPQLTRKNLSYIVRSIRNI